MGRVEGKVVIVTGGAVGLGEAMARMMAREGAKVVVADVQDAQGEALARALPEAMYLHLDVAQEADWERAMQRVREAYGRVDVVINNAGIAISGPPEEQRLEDWRRLMSVNLDGVFLGTKHAIRAMKHNQPRGGSIVNLSSIEGLVGDPDLGAYNASKGGVRLYTKSVALYCARERLNIRVNSIHPGYIWTPMVEAHLARQGDVAAGRKALDAMHPIGHVGVPKASLMTCC